MGVLVDSDKLTLVLAGGEPLFCLQMRLSAALCARFCWLWCSQTTTVRAWTVMLSTTPCCASRSSWRVVRYVSDVLVLVLMHTLLPRRQRLTLPVWCVVCQRCCSYCGVPASLM